MKKRITAAVLAASIMLTASGCGTDNGSQQPANDTQSIQNDQPAEQPEQTEAEPMSVPVKFTADGEIDMEAALSYTTDFDALQAQLDAKQASPDHPVSENTNEETLALYKWLKEQYDSGNTISAQQLGDKSWMEDIAYYYYTNDLPAIMGFDFIFKTTPDGDGSDWTQMAIDWHTKCGGIVYFCWHWNVPCDINDPDSKAYAFYSKKNTSASATTDFSIENAVTPGTKEYEIVVHDIELIASELQRLEAAGVPVLWRPLHEASGNWFWWGLQSKDLVEKQCYQKLWYMIFDRLENYHKLTNLIWVWNGQTKHCTVHENTYDISGIDVYPTSEDHSVQQKSYESLKSYTADGKMLALSECGYIPDSDELKANKDVKWLFFMPWNFEFIYKGSTVLGIPRINEEKMTTDFFRKVITADNIITWSELPTFPGTEKALPERVQMMQHDMEIQKEKDDVS